MQHILSFNSLMKKSGLEYILFCIKELMNKFIGHLYNCLFLKHVTEHNI